MTTGDDTCCVCAGPTRLGTEPILMDMTLFYASAHDVRNTCIGYKKYRV